MPLSAGTRLGSYVIESPLGAGGMGEVYRASDARLGRDVAIKVLSTALLPDEERLRRFTQEARTIAALNHPNILAIFDVGSQDGMSYLVSELLEGETLRSKLIHGALPLRKVIDYSRQIAHGLAAAHEKGIIHRDLKPENIFITRDGRVKLLDFGLAKLVEAEKPSGDHATQTMSLTVTGTVVGTPAYMSPEQVRGQLTDARTDIFSLGVVLTEMISGQSPFRRESSVETMNAILKEDPLTPQQGPAALAHIIQHCLEKSPAERFQSARDLAFALESLSTSSSTARVVALPARRTWVLQRGVLFAAIAVAVGAIAGWWLRAGLTPRPAASAFHFNRLTDFVGIETYPAVSPDGKSVAFVSDAGGSQQIWIHLFAGGTPLQLTHGAGQHLYPRWTQDSASIVYYSPPAEGGAQGTLWQISALGGAARKLAASISDADVSHDGTKLAFFRAEGGQVQLVVSDRDGLNPKIVQQIAPGRENLHPRWSPDDRWIAYQYAGNIWSDDIYVVSSSGGEAKKITNEGVLMSGLTWLPDGSGVIYSSARGSTVLYLPLLHLWLQKLDHSPARQLTFGDSSYDQPDIGRDGSIVASRWHMQFDIWKFPITGEAAENAARGVRITEQTGQVQTPTLSPDDKEMAFLWDSGGHGNIWVKNLASGELRQITNERDAATIVGVPVWSPDGSSIAYWRNDGYWAIAPDGSNLRNLVQQASWATWSHDSRWLYYSEEPRRSMQIDKVPSEGGDPVPVRRDGGMGPMLSPDAKTLYYVVPLERVNGTLDYEIRSAQPENAPSKLLARIAADRIPIWQGLHPVISHDGKWLALPLNDNYGTNLWLLSTADGSLRRVVDFGNRRTFVARRFAWSSDDRFLYAAVGEGDADIVSLTGVVSPAQ